MASVDENDIESLFSHEIAFLNTELSIDENQTKRQPYELMQNRPNPFTNETSIAYYIPETQDAILSVYDLDGKLIYEVNNKQSKGYGEFIINNNSKIESFSISTKICRKYWKHF